MKDIDRVRILHDLKSKFEIDDSALDDLTRQVGDDAREKIERFHTGYEAEDGFQLLWSIMPWTRLVHPLGQNQQPDESKKVYQVPDFLIFAESYKNEHLPLLVEVKRVTGEKQSLKLMKKQVELSQRYSARLGLNLVYAIQWDKIGLWTINAKDAFEVKSSSLKLAYDKAIRYDLSVIFGDMAHFFPQPIFRKSSFDSSEKDPSRPSHAKYGLFVDDAISLDGKTYHSLANFESAVIDVAVQVHETSVSSEGSKTLIAEETSAPYISKFSSLVRGHLGLLQGSLAPEECLASASVVWGLLEKIGVKRMHVFPHADLPETREIAVRFMGKIAETAPEESDGVVEAD